MVMEGRFTACVAICMQYLQILFWSLGWWHPLARRATHTLIYTITIIAMQLTISQLFTLHLLRQIRQNSSLIGTIGQVPKE